MAIYKGNKKVVAVYKGSTPINKIYKGATLVFQKSGGSQSVPVIITFTDASDPANRKYAPVCEGTTKTAESQTIELPSEGETYKFGSDWQGYTQNLLEIRNYSNNCPSVTSFSKLFYSAKNMKTLTFAKGMDTSKIKSMAYMFALCSSLVSLDLSSFNTSNCTSFGNMFYLTSLVSLDLSGFDMSNATSFNGMFNFCFDLTHIKCKQAFKDWCITHQDEIELPSTMREGGSGTWEIID